MNTNNANDIDAARAWLKNKTSRENDATPQREHKRKEQNKMRQARYRAKQKAARNGPDCDLKQKAVAQEEEAKERKAVWYKKQREEKKEKENKKNSVMRPCNYLSSSSSSSKTFTKRTSKRINRKKKSDPEQLINEQVSAFLTSIIEADDKNVENMTEKALKLFQWFPKPTHLTGEDPKETSTEKEETTLWYHPTATEYHRWLTVQKSSVSDNTEDTTEGYGLFAERKFYKADILSIYLGEYIAEGEEDIYTLTQTLPGGV